MNLEETTKTAAGLFITVLVASLVSAALGALFASVISLVSPDLVSDLFNREEGDRVLRYAAAVGMIWGLFIGAAVSCFASLLAVVVKVIRIRLEYRRDKEANQ